MIQMGMGQNHSINVGRLEGEAVLAKPFSGITALMHATLQ